MKSRTSFLKIWMEYFRRQSWVLVLSFIGFFLALPVSVLMVFSMMNKNDTAFVNKKTQFMELLSGSTGVPAMWPMLVLIGGALIGMIVGWSSFSYLHDRRKTDLYHSIPIKRRELFLINLVTCVVDYMLPAGINTILFAAIAAMRGMNDSRIIRYSLLMLILGLVYCIYFYGISLLSMMLTGKILIGVMGTFVLELFPAIAFLLKDIMYSAFFATYASEFAAKSALRKVLSPFGLLAEAACIQDRSPVIVIMEAVILGGALLLVSWYLYEKRPSECAGQSMVFAAPAALIKILLTVEGAMTIGLLFRFIMVSDYWFFFGLILGILFVYGFVQMIYYLDIRRVLGYPLHLAIAAALVFLISVWFCFDLSGYDTKLPARDNISEIAFVSDTDYDFGWSDNSYSVNQVMERMHFQCDEEMYGILSDFVKYSRKEKEDGEEPDGSYGVYVRVTQGKGKSYYRYYKMDYEKVKEDLAALYNRKEYARGVYVITTCSPEDVRFINFENAYGEEAAGKPYSEEVRRLAKALKEDLEETRGGDVFSQTPVGILRCCLSDDGKKIRQEDEYAYTQSMRIYPSYKRTLALLEEMGFDTSMPKPERIKMITSYDADGKETMYTDPEIIGDMSVKMIPDCCMAPWLEKADPDVSYSMTLYPETKEKETPESLEISCILLK